jgi:Flp pilus assembly protein TadD
MCRKLVLAATVLSLSAVFVAPVLAADSDQQAKPAKAEKIAPPRKASAEQRAAAERADPLARAAFWAHELEINPADQEASLRMAVALRQMSRFDQGAEAAERVTIADPGNAEAWLEIARNRIGAGKGFYAIEPARKAQALKPKDWRAGSLLGIALEQSERYDEAEAAYRAALALSPDNPAVLSNLAMMKAGQGDTALAETLLRKAAVQPGSTIQIRQNLAMVLGLGGKMAEAERLMRQDLPPEIANNNLAYLRAMAAGGQPGAAGRSYQNLQRSQDGG